MALNLAQKKALVADVNAVAASSLSAVVAEYRGLTVAEMTELRSEARNAGVYMKVVRNSLARRAVEGTQFECIQPSLRGPLLLGLLQGRSGLRGARGQGILEGTRQSRHRFGGSGRRALRRDEPGQSGVAAEPGRGASDAAANSERAIDAAGSGAQRTRSDVGASPAGAQRTS